MQFNRPVDYEPRYICTDGMLKYPPCYFRKQIPAVSEQVLEHPIRHPAEMTPRRMKKYKKSENLPSCHELYYRSGKYKQVYRRSKKVEVEQYFS